MRSRPERVIRPTLGLRHGQTPYGRQQVGKSSAMDESLTEQRRVSDEVFGRKNSVVREKNKFLVE